MEFPDFDPNSKLAAVYYNGGTPPHLFKILNNVTLSGLKDELDCWVFVLAALLLKQISLFV